MTSGSSVRLWGPVSGCGVQCQAVGSSVRVWGPVSGCWVQCQGVGSSVKLQGPVPGCRVQCQAVGAIQKREVAHHKTNSDGTCAAASVATPSHFLSVTSHRDGTRDALRRPSQLLSHYTRIRHGEEILRATQITSAIRHSAP